MDRAVKFVEQSREMALLVAHPKILKDGRDKLVSIAQLMCEDNVEKSEEELVNILEEVQFIKDSSQKMAKTLLAQRTQK
jgi:hypothetical protein